MLGLTKKTEYALVALSHLARDSECRTSAREIADRYHVPLPLLMNVMKQLQQRQLVKSMRGSRGGYCLAVAAEQITLDDVVVAMEGVVSLTQCTADDGGATKGRCDRAAGCPMRSPVKTVNDRFREFLRSVTLSDMAKQASTEAVFAQLVTQTCEA